MFLYEITNLVTGMGYVGATSDKPELRLNNHKYYLEKGEHHNFRLQDAYYEFGKDAFIYKVRASCSTRLELRILENKVLKEEKNRLYNLILSGFKSVIASRPYFSKGHRLIPVIGMSIWTGELKEYPSIKDTSKDGFNHKNVSKCAKLHVCLGGGREQMAISTNGFVWMHKSEFKLTEMKRRVRLALNRGKNNRKRIPPALNDNLIE